MRLRPYILVIVALLVPWGAAAQAEEKGIWGYYIGLTYTSTTSYAAISYDAPSTPTLPNDCSTSTNQPNTMSCNAYLSPDTSDASSFSVYIEKPFERQGLFYFEPGLTFSTISYTGGLGSKPTLPGASSSSSNPQPMASGNGSGSAGGSAPQAVTQQPLTRAQMYMYGVNWQGYVRFGITPKYLPDLLFTLGLGVQTVGGQIKIFAAEETRFVLQPDGFGEIELVLARYNGGALSLFYGQDQTLASQFNSNLIPDHPSGTNLSNFQLNLVAGSAGVRLLFPL